MSQVSFQKKRRRTGQDPSPAADSPTAGGQRRTVTPRHPDHSPSTEERSPWETMTVDESPPWNIEGSSPWSKIEHPLS